jgi:hypothetical protein
MEPDPGGPKTYRSFGSITLIPMTGYFQILHRVRAAGGAALLPAHSCEAAQDTVHAGGEACCQHTLHTGRTRAHRYVGGLLADDLGFNILHKSVLRFFAADLCSFGWGGGGGG